MRIAAIFLSILLIGGLLGVAPAPSYATAPEQAASLTAQGENG